MRNKGSLVPVLDRRRTSSLAEYLDFVKEDKTQFMAKVEEKVESDHSSDSHKEDDEEHGYEESDMYMPGFNSKAKKMKTNKERPGSPSFRVEKSRSFDYQKDVDPYMSTKVSVS
jgi:hypothetical protein